MEFSNFLFFHFTVESLVIFSVLLALVTAAICLKNPFWGLLAIVFLLPFEKLGSYSLNPATGHPTVRLIQIASASLIFSCAVLVLIKKLALRRIAGMRLLILFGLSSLLSAYLVNYFRVWQIYLWVIFVIALFYFAAQWINKENLKKIEKILFTSLAFVVIFGIYQFFADLAGLPPHISGLTHFYQKEVFGFPRIQSTSIEPLYYANYLLIPIFVGLATLVSQKKKIEGKIWALSGITALNFILTMSRGAFIAFFFGIVVFLFLFFDEFKVWIKEYGRKIIQIAVTALVVSIILLFVSSKITYGDSTKGPRIYAELITTKVFKTGSFTGRVESQKEAWEIFKKNPVFGVGIGGYAPAIYNYPPERLERDWAVPNSHALQLLAETGLVGFSIYFLFVGVIVLSAFRTFRKTQDPRVKAWLGGLMAALTAIFVQHQSFSGFFLTHIWILFAFLAGLSSGDKYMNFSFKKIREII